LERRNSALSLHLQPLYETKLKSVHRCRCRCYSNHFFCQNHTIELTATDKSGNVATESSTIQVVKPIVFKIPNAFSPGINGRNDVINFEEATQNESSINSVTVIDRNGDVIYESNNDFIWNGSNKSGELAPAGVYTYLIRAIDKLGESRMNKGTIQLFRE
jgi:gliding motility-associated-like protein